MSPFGESDLILNKDGSVYHLNLLPKHLADTIISVGDPSQVFQVTEYFEKVDFEMNKGEFVTQTGRYKGKRISVISTGIGSDNIEIFFNELDLLVNYDFKKNAFKSRRKKLKIIRIGTSAAIQEDIPIGGFLVSEFGVGLDNVVKYYKLKTTEFEKSIAECLSKEVELPERPYVVKGSEELLSRFSDGYILGNTVSTPGFYAPQGRTTRVAARFPKLLTQLNYFHSHEFWLSNCEMETAAYYAFGRIMGHEVLSITAILGNRIRNTFTSNSNRVTNSLINKVLNQVYEADS